MSNEVTLQQKEYPMDGCLRIKTSREKPVGITSVALGVILFAGGVVGFALSCTYGKDWGFVDMGDEKVSRAFLSTMGSVGSVIIGMGLFGYGYILLNGGPLSCKRSYTPKEAQERYQLLHNPISCRSLKQWLRSRGGVASLVRSGVLLPAQGDELRRITDPFPWNELYGDRLEQAWRAFQESILTSEEATEFDRKKQEMSSALSKAKNEKNLGTFGEYLKSNGGVEVAVALGVLSQEEAYTLSKALQESERAQSDQASWLKSVQVHLSAQSAEAAGRAASTPESNASS